MFGLSFFSMAMLVGLVAVAIPPIIHLLNRRRYDVLDWGAMQFLQVSEVTRRRMMLEELLLMLLRMALIAILVLAIAGPYVERHVPVLSAVKPNRDVVLIFDGSASMGYRGTGKSAQEEAREWAAKFLELLNPGDSVAVIVARKQPLVLVERLTVDRQKVLTRIQKGLPAPGGISNWPDAVKKAAELLEDSQKGLREIILIGDGQKYTWSDRNTMLGWEALRLTHGDLLAEPAASKKVKTNLWVVNVAPDRPPQPGNWSLAELNAGRALVSIKQKVRFTSAILLSGDRQYEKPYDLRVEIRDDEGKEVTDRLRPRLPEQRQEISQGQVPFQFEHAFEKPGLYLVSVILEPDPPPGRRPENYTVKDHLPDDNRRHLVVEVVPALPVLIVDNEPLPDATRRGSDYLRFALAPKNDPAPAVKVAVKSARDFKPADLLGADATARPSDLPRVLILHDVRELSIPQQEAVDIFLRQGGGLLVMQGENISPEHYDKALYRDGAGWLPARTVKLQGDGDPQRGARLDVQSFAHPALNLFREVQQGRASPLHPVWLSRWWRLTIPQSRTQAAVAARLDREDPFLVERRYHDGRVLQCAVALDDSRRTNLVLLPAFVPLAHELVYYLAGARVAEFNLAPGEPLRYRVPRGTSLEKLRLTSPTGETRPLRQPSGDGEDDSIWKAEIQEGSRETLVVCQDLRESGVWTLQTSDGKKVYYTVQDPGDEADLTPASEDDRQKVGKHVPFRYQNDPEQMHQEMQTISQRQELWWLFLIGLLVFLLAEIWMTRRIVRNR